MSGRSRRGSPDLTDRELKIRVGSRLVAASAEETVHLVEPVVSDGLGGLAVQDGARERRLGEHLEVPSACEHLAAHTEDGPERVEHPL